MNPAIALALIFQLTVLSASYKFVVPSFRDTTIKTRVTRGLQPPRVTILRLKGPRERSESELTSTGATSLTRIWQCDRKAWITLFDFNKTSFPSTIWMKMRKPEGTAWLVMRSST